MSKKIILKIVELYQIIISPIIGGNCRFYPSCSCYTYQAVKKYGAGKGLWLGLKRIIRCHPWSEGGVDRP